MQKRRKWKVAGFARMSYPHTRTEMGTNCCRSDGSSRKRPGTSVRGSRLGHRMLLSMLRSVKRRESQGLRSKALISAQGGFGFASPLRSRARLAVMDPGPYS